MFHTLGVRIVRRARLVLAVALVALIGAAVVGVGVFGHVLSGGFADPRSASTQATTLLAQHFGGEDDLLVLVHARAGTVDSPAAAADGQALTRRLAADPRLTGVSSYWATHAAALASTDHTDALIAARVVGVGATGDTNATAVLAAYAHTDTPAVTVRVGGDAGTGIGTQVSKDLAVAESIAIPLTLVLLLLAFGSLVSALLPLAVAVIAVFGCFAELDLLTHVTSVSVFAINVATALGLGLGIDYSLLIVNRFREELTGGATVPDAVAATTASAGRTVAFSAVTVAAALSAMLVFPVYVLKSFAYAGVGVTLIAAVAALVVLPALLTVLGHRVNAGRVPGLKVTRAAESPSWARLARGVMRRPVLTAVPVVAVLALLALPLLHLSVGTPDAHAIPASAPAHQVADVLTADFATQPDPVEVLLTPAVSPAALTSYTRTLTAMPGVQHARAATADGIQRISLATNLPATSPAAQSLVTAIRAVPAPAATTVLVGGDTATLVDTKHAIGSKLPLAGLIIVLTSLILLFLFTGSVIQPLRALLGNVLTLGSTLGIMVWMFQDGHLHSLFGFTPGAIDTSIPVLLFCIAFGLSMDYEVFLISRIKELHDEGATTADATTHGLAKTGRIVSTAAVLLAVSFFSFATGHVGFIQLFGLGTGLAILLDATLVRGILVPASMRLLGEHAWYAPTVLRRLHTRIGLADTTPPAAASTAPVPVDRDPGEAPPAGGRRPLDQRPAH